MNDPEKHQVSRDALIWHRYDSEIKAELFATALRTDAGTLLVDPFASIERLPDCLEGASPLTGVFVTNANHLRSAAAYATKFALPIYRHRDVEADFGSCAVREANAASAPAVDLRIFEIEGAVAGEIALHSSRDRGTLVIGDALINMGSYGFMFLPAKYCQNSKAMRRSLSQLLDLTFERILFAHGMPIVTSAKERLALLLGTGR